MLRTKTKTERVDVSCTLQVKGRLKLMVLGSLRGRDAASHLVPSRVQRQVKLIEARVSARQAKRVRVMVPGNGEPLEVLAVGPELSKATVREARRARDEPKKQRLQEHRTESGRGCRKSTAVVARRTSWSWLSVRMNDQKSRTVSDWAL